MMQLVLFAKVACICYMALLATVACSQRIETNFNISRNKIELGEEVCAENTNIVVVS